MGLYNWNLCGRHYIIPNVFYNTHTTSLADVTLVHHLLALEDILIMHAVNALGYVNAIKVINATTTIIFILVDMSSSSSASYPLSGLSCYNHLQNFVSLIVAI